MNTNKQYLSVPGTLADLAGFSGECACGKTHAIDTKYFSVAAGAVGEISSVVARFAKGRIGVLADGITIDIAGRRLIETLQKDGREVSVYIVPNGAGGRPHATFDAVRNVQKQLADTDFLIAVGSGTINDLAKLASFRLDKQYMVVPTAPSMNGYTSAIAAIMKDGLKQTVACHQPVAVVADLDILCAAPIELVQAGLGDLESKPVSTADFLLSSLLRNTYYCPVPGAVVADAEARVAAGAKGLLTGDKASIAVLTEALLLSGCSMKLAGSSSPASGGEHLISHYWDMTADQEGRVEGWHGAQVGVSTIVTATLYEYLRRQSPANINITKLVRARSSAAQDAARIEANHGDFGKLVAAEYLAKRLDDDAYRTELEYIVDNWQRIWKSLSMLKSAAVIRNVLRQAGAPTKIGALGLTPTHLKNSFLRAREIRGRFTVLDFAAEIGMLDAAVDEVLATSQCLSD